MTGEIISNNIRAAAIGWPDADARDLSLHPALLHQGIFLGPSRNRGGVSSIPGGDRAGESSAAGERRRLENIARPSGRCAAAGAGTSSRTTFRPGYLQPGRIPATAPWTVGEEDERLLGTYAAPASRSCSCTRNGTTPSGSSAPTSSPRESRGLRRFIAWRTRAGCACCSTVHGLLRGARSGFQEGVARDGTALVELWYRYARCSPTSPSWRAYVMPRLLR